MDQVTPKDQAAAKNEAGRETRKPNDLPEARDSTTEKIHNLSDFNVSDSLGIPLLTKDAANSRPRSGAEEEGRLMSGGAKSSDRSLFGSLGSGVFDVFGQRDRLAFGVAAAMMLLPLLGGSTGFLR